MASSVVTPAGSVHKSRGNNVVHKLMLVEEARGDHMEEAYSRVGLMTALEVAMSVPFCIPHPVAVSVFIICSGLCACTEML